MIQLYRQYHLIPNIRLYGVIHALLPLCTFSQSDDNLLKNIELFDKLSLRFNRRILFVKDVIGSQEICCWSFYGHGQKLCEVCCTSIVYGTDKKHTKVRPVMTIVVYIMCHWIHLTTNLVTMSKIHCHF